MSASAVVCLGCKPNYRHEGSCLIDEQYLADQSVVGNLEELLVGLWDEMYANMLNILSSAKKLVSLDMSISGLIMIC